MADVVDVCVVGSGAGGCAAALVLARAGMSVVVLEKGPRLTREQLVHDELVVVRRNTFVPFVADEPHVLRAAVADDATRGTFGWISCVVGGGTVHWAGYSFRLHPYDFQRRTISGGIAGSTVADWPLSYDDLEPYYAMAERELGVSGAGGVSPFEPARACDYPLPPIAEHPLARVVDAAGKRAGVHPYATPRAVLSRPYEGRAACMYCDFCASYGCEVGAKGSAPDALLPKAQATGRCRVIPQAMVTEVPVDDAGGARGAVYLDEKGVEHEQRARILLLACSAIETPRLLLSSTSARFPDGLANFSGNVGRNIMFLTKSSVAADFHFARAEKIEGLESRHPFIGRAVRDHYQDAGTYVVDFAPMSPIAVAERLSIADDGGTLWGKALKDRLRRHYRDGKHVDVEGFSETLPQNDNRVELDASVADRFGLASARVTFSHHEHDLERSARLARHGRALLDEMRPDIVFEPESGGTFDVLQMGSCRFGDDPRTSVLNRDCRTHDVENLYVVDSSFMPTSGAVPPTLTIMANAFRVAASIVARAQRGEVPR